MLDHHQAAVLALNHLKDLHHERIAFMKGNPISSDAKDRWDAICEVADQIGIKIDPELTVQIDTDDPTPMLGYPFAKQLLARGKPFTAIFAYNDISAIGAIELSRSAGSGSRRIFRSSGSMTFPAPHSTPPVSPPFASR